MYLIVWFSLLLGSAVPLASAEIVYSHNFQDVLPHPHTAAGLSDFAHFSLVQPSYLHSRTKRQISSTKLNQDSTEHINHLAVKYSINNTLYILDLILNRDLLPASYFEKHQQDGAYVIRNRTNAKDIELCHYKGVLRDVPGSWAAISTCDNNLRGVIYDGSELNYIEPLLTNQSTTIRHPNVSHSNTADSNELSQHILYKHSDFVSHDKYQCGYKSAHDKLRTKRDTLTRHDTIRGPWNANVKSRYLELVLVVDNKLYNLFRKSTKDVYTHCKDIVNVINALYEKLNIFVALVGVVIWTETDEIPFNTNGDLTLNNFLTYRRERLVREHPNDNAQLLTGMTFQDGVVGKALKGPICTYEFSGGVNVDHNSAVGLVATTVAHEMGHNLGMEHDTSSGQTPECKCPSDRCIMSPSSSSISPTEWSSCSQEYLALAFDHGMDYCMRNKPKA
uniref:Disintegrin and metalloproteinase domain-containing protein 28 n=1 Tax=Cacopsylla melanoneura TaxID=428564 RepID=A0A8D8YRY3_9HEMI